MILVKDVLNCSNGKVVPERYPKYNEGAMIFFIKYIEHWWHGSTKKIQLRSVLGKSKKMTQMRRWFYSI